MRQLHIIQCIKNNALSFNNLSRNWHELNSSHPRQCKIIPKPDKLNGTVLVANVLIAQIHFSEGDPGPRQ